MLEKAMSALARRDYQAANPIIIRYADCGNSRAQVLLGGLYENGEGRSLSNNGAYMWYSLAVLGGNAAAPGLKDRVAARLQAVEIAQADHQVKSWRPRPCESGGVNR
jgi:TPR repeat protein